MRTDFDDVFLKYSPQNPSRPPTQCTFLRTNRTFQPQEAYQCLTCNFQHSDTLCTYCARECHKGHTLIGRGVLNCFCDCGDPENERLNGRHCFAGEKQRALFKKSSVLVYFTVLWNSEIFFLELSSFSFNAWSIEGKKSSVSAKFKWSDEGKTLVFEGEKMKILKEWVLTGVEDKYNIEKSTILEDGSKCHSCQESLKRAGTVVINLENGGVYCSSHIQFDRLAQLYTSDARKLHDLFAMEEKKRLEVEKERREREERQRVLKELERMERRAKEKESLENERMEREIIENIRRMAVVDRQKMEIGRLESERLEEERRERERKQKESERIKREQMEKQKEKERMEKERVEREVLEKQRKERERMEKEREEMETLERIEKERMEAIEKERERVARETTAQSVREKTDADHYPPSTIQTTDTEHNPPSTRQSPAPKNETPNSLLIEDWDCEDVINWFKTLKLSKDFSETIRREALDGSGLLLVVEDQLFSEFDIKAKTDTIKITRGLQKLQSSAHYLK